MHDVEWLKNAILIFGPRKAGTTLLQSLLDGGQEYLVRPGELKVKFFFRELWETPADGRNQYYLNRRKLSDFKNFDFNGYIKHISGSSAIQNSVADLMKDEMSTVYKYVDVKPEQIRGWIAKEAGGNITKVAPFWKQLFLNGRMLFIVRDPLMVVRSIITDGRRNGQYMDWQRIRKEVATVHRTLYQMKKLMDKPWVYTIAYEDLIADTEGAIKKITDFINTESDEIFLKPTVFGVPVEVRTSSKSVKHVFRSRKKWYNDLTNREIVLIYLFNLKYRRLNYNELRKNL